MFSSVSASSGAAEETDAGVAISAALSEGEGGRRGLSAWSCVFLRDLFSSACVHHDPHPTFHSKTGLSTNDTTALPGSLKPNCISIVLPVVILIQHCIVTLVSASMAQPRCSRLLPRSGHVVLIKAFNIRESHTEGLMEGRIYLFFIRKNVLHTLLPLSGNSGQL